jgi:hypothetical protein
VDSLKGALFKPGCLAAGYAASFVIADVTDAESKKVIEKSPILDQEEPSGPLKREAPAAAAKPAGDKKAKKKA